MTWPPTTHQDVQDDLANGHGWAASMVERFGISEQALPTPFPWWSSRYFSAAANALATTSIAPNASRLILAPIYFPTTRAVDQIAINVSTAGTATHVARLGIYNASSSSGFPTTVKVDAGSVAIDSTGVKTLTISTTLTGLYWLAMTAQSGTFTALAVGGCPPVGGLAQPDSQATGGLMRNSTSPTSALPDLTGDATVATIASSIPRVVVRAV